MVLVSTFRPSVALETLIRPNRSSIGSVAGVREISPRQLFLPHIVTDERDGIETFPLPPAMLQLKYRPRSSLESRSQSAQRQASTSEKYGSQHRLARPAERHRDRLRKKGWSRTFSGFQPRLARPAEHHRARLKKK